MIYFGKRTVTVRARTDTKSLRDAFATRMTVCSYNLVTTWSVSKPPVTPIYPTSRLNPSTP